MSIIVWAWLPHLLSSVHGAQPMGAPQTPLWDRESRTASQSTLGGRGQVQWCQSVQCHQCGLYWGQCTPFWQHAGGLASWLHVCGNFLQQQRGQIGPLPPPQCSQVRSCHESGWYGVARPGGLPQGFQWLYLGRVSGSTLCWEHPGVG